MTLPGWPILSGSIGSGHTYSFEMSSGTDAALPSSMVLALYTLTEDTKDNGLVGMEAGHIGPEDRPNDTAWQPA